MIKKDVVRTKDYSYRLKDNNYEYIPDKLKPLIQHGTQLEKWLAHYSNFEDDNKTMGRLKPIVLKSS